MTSFYAGSVKRNVNIPNDKVCGYKIKNDIMPCGYSSGVRTGRDNGIVNQKLSRFATNEEVKDKDNCAGNTNWLNHRGPEFRKTRSGNAFSLERKSFKAGDGKIFQKLLQKSLKNKRSGLGNYNITRNNFTAPPILGRKPVDFEKLQALDIEQFGTKIQLSDKTIETLFTINVGDPTDTKWIDEYNIRLASGENDEQIRLNPPFGRPQRMIKKKVNFAQQGLTLEEQINSISAAITAGFAENRQDIANASAAISRVLSSEENIRRLTLSQFNQLRNAVNRLNIPKNWRAAGLPHRIWTKDEYKNDPGLVNLYLMSNIPPSHTPNQPVVSVADDGTTQLMTLASMVSALGRRPTTTSPNTQPKYLDVQNRAVITRQQAIDLVNNGVDNGLLGGVFPPAGGWTAPMTVEMSQAGEP